MQDVISGFAESEELVIALVPRKCNMAADLIAVEVGKGLYQIGWVNSPATPLVRILDYDAKARRGSADMEGSRVETEDRSGIG